MDVVLAVSGKVVVDDQGDLLNVDTTGKEIGGDEDTGRSGTELFHDDITLGLVHVTVHGGDGEVTGSELVGEPVDLPTGVAEDDGLGDGDGLVQIGEGVELPVLLLNGNVELLDTFEGKLVLLDEDADGVTHELGGDLEDVLGHGGGEKDDLGALGQKLEDVVDLLGETTGQHLVGLVEDEHLHVVGLEDTALDHVLDTAGGADDDVGTLGQSLHVLTNAGAANAGVALDVHEVTDGDNDLLDLLGKLAGGGEDERLAGLDVGIELLENGDGEGSRFTGTGLGLRNHITAWVASVAVTLQAQAQVRARVGWRGTLTVDDGHDGTLLDGGGALETVGVDSAKELGLEVHGVERVGDLIVVGLDLAWGGVSERTSKKGTATARPGDTRRARRVSHRHGAGRHSPSGTSSRPLSAMIGSAETRDYRRWAVVEEGSLVAGLWAVVILGIPPLSSVLVVKKLDTRSSRRESKGYLECCVWLVLV